MSIPEIIDRFINNWSSKNELYLKIGTVSDINEKDYTFTFTPLDETSEVLDVRMKTVVDDFNESFIVVPKENTTVVVAFHSKNVAQCMQVKEASKIFVNSSFHKQNNENKELNISSQYVINCDDVKVNTDSWVYNNGNFGGLIKINILEDKLNNLVDQVNGIKDSLNSHKHIGGTLALGLTGIPTTSASSVDSFDKSDFENNKIKH